MATTPIQPGTSTGYQVVYLNNGNLLLTQFEALAADDVIEWDDEFATGGATASPTSTIYGPLFGPLAGPI